MTLGSSHVADINFSSLLGCTDTTAGSRYIKLGIKISLRERLGVVC